MARNQGGAAAPHPLTQWIDHLKRSRLAAKKARRAERKRRAATKARLFDAERLLASIIASADVVAQGVDPEGAPSVYMLLTLHTARFNDLAIFGSELEDLEDGGDAEPTEADEGEATLGRTERLMQPEEEGRDDTEPDLGSTGMVDQRRWHEGGRGDLELDRADNEPSIGVGTPDFDACDLGEQREYQRTAQDDAISEEARRRYAPATGSKVVAVPARDPTGKAGAGLLQRRGGGAK